MVLVEVRRSHKALALSDQRMQVSVSVPIGIIPGMILIAHQSQGQLAALV